MRSVQLVAHGAPGKFEVREVAVPRPAPDEVLLRVKACGVNRLDLWAEEAGLPVPISLPRVLGGEAAGVIEELGADVDDWRRGDRVAVQSNLSCGVCEYCLKGEESTCLQGKLFGVDCDGGFQEFTVVPARALVRIPEGLDFPSAASLALAGSTAMHMLTNRIELRSSDWVLVIAGASGVGSYAIQIANQLGAHVIATASTDQKRNYAAGLGAEHVLDSNGDWPAEVRRITQKRGVDVVVEHVGGEVLPKAFQCLGRGGTVVTCGATAGREVCLNLWPIFVKQQRLVGSYGRTRADLEATLEWAALKRIRPCVHETYPFDRLADGIAMLRERRALGKIVMIP